ncbi:MAG: hypothetical protein SGILL_003128, partial [Bacillariaceae sp.]
MQEQKRDWKEALDMGVPGTRDWSVPDDQDDNLCLDGWNQLPPTDILPDFRAVVTKFFDACAKLADHIAVLMAKGLGQDENSSLIKELREKHSSYLRANYYPLCDATQVAEDGSKPLGISPHRDAGFLTVLLQDVDCHSLQVLKDDQWITIHPEPYAFTINTGDMAEVWSNGKYKAPLHRVLSNETRERYSTPFFYNPSYATRVEPLAVTTVGEEDNTEEKKSSGNNYQEAPMYLGVLWGYFRAVRFAGDLTDLGVEIQVADFLCDKPSSHVTKQEIFVKQADFGVPFSVEKYRHLLQAKSDGDQTTSTSRKNPKSALGTTPMMTVLAICFITAVSLLPTSVEASTRSPLVSRNPFNKERTGVSGFGSRSIRKTIFSMSASLSSEKEAEEESEHDSEIDSESLPMMTIQGESVTEPARLTSLDRESSKLGDEVDEAADSAKEACDDETQFEDDYEDILSTTGSNRLWVQRSKEDPDVLWVLIGSDDGTKKKTTLKLSVSDTTGDWQVQRKNPSKRFLQQYPIEQWVPIEGFYGLYRVPSGILWVLVSKTEPVYSAPPLKGASSSSSWLDIRRIVNLEI